MDYIVTNDKDMIKTLQRIREERPTKLEVINMEKLMDFLHTLPQS
jgi:hypothetical protein